MKHLQFASAFVTCAGLVFWSPSGLADHTMAAASAQAPASGGLAVVSLNMAREADAGRIVAEWRARPSLGSADVWLLQEVVHLDGEQPSVAHIVAGELGLHVASAPMKRGNTVEGLAILSRYPLRDVDVRQLPVFDLVYRSRSRIALAATVDTPSGSVRVFNAHLDTRINARERVAQLAPVIQEAAAWPGPVVLGGDFNTNYMRWIRSLVPIPFAHYQAAPLDKALAARGFSTLLRRTGPTFDHFGFQLDWIYTREMDASEARVQPVDFSDHHAVRVRAVPRLSHALSTNATTATPKASITNGTTVSSVP
jgi:endonuclease/exonuclease/phosphatase family metal-dependent hydrolase